MVEKLASRYITPGGPASRKNGTFFAEIREKSGGAFGPALCPEKTRPPAVR
jgi:hypothetical protein